MAELLYGGMRTSFDFTYEGQEIIAEDGSSMDEIFDESIAVAKQMTIGEPSLLFELRRRIIERGELEDMKLMAEGSLLTNEGEKANTIIVLSDFPEELMDAKEDLGGYNVSRKQTMMRIIHEKDDGTISVITRSLDGSNRQALEEVGALVGHEFEEGELLGQRINLNLPSQWQSNLENKLVDTYDNSLSAQKGGSWHAGIEQPDNRAHINTYEFAEAQTDLIEWFTNLKMSDPTGAEKVRFQLAATVDARYERFVAISNESNGNISSTVSEAKVTINAYRNTRTDLQEEMGRASRRAALGRKTFSGCGVSSTAESETDDDDDLATTASDRMGYGNRSRGGKGDCEFKSKKCPECKRPNVWTKVTRRGDLRIIEGKSNGCKCRKVVKATD
jgi:hypothetical protein